jgi:hypothetical protein
VADNIKAAGSAAGLSASENKKIDDFYKSLEAHKTLSNMPQDLASKKYAQYTPEQRANLVNNFGNEDPTVKQNRGWFGTAWHYTIGGAVNKIGEAASGLLAGLNNVSDLSTRTWRTLQIAGDQNVGLSDAWTIANDKGDKVFSPNRIIDAKVKWGNDAVDIAMRIASGEAPEAIMKSATPEQQKYVMLADTKTTVIPGLNTPEEVAAARANFQDTLDSVNASKYSFGRFIANAVTPAEMEGSGFYYKAVSGAFDAAYRVLADPLLIAGKGKRMYDVSKYALDVVIGGGKVDEVFANPAVVSFWDQYGAKLAELRKVQTAKNPIEIDRVKRELATIAPEFGPAIIKSFMEPKVPITNAVTAKAFFENNKQLVDTFAGTSGRQRVLMPRMDPIRKARISAVTTGKKTFNIDQVGPGLTNDYYFGSAPTSDGVAEVFINGTKEFIQKVNAKTNPKEIGRFSTAYIMYRIDRAKAKFTLAPMFKSDVFDVTDTDASEKIYRLAVMVMPTRESRILAESFGSLDDVGKKKDVYYGLWETIAEIRGLKTTLPGQAIIRTQLGKGQSVHSVSKSIDAYPEKGAIPSDFNPFVSVPTLTDLDRAASRNTLTQKLIGMANSDFASKMVGAWSFLTLAGPRYALRNAGEDLMVNLAIGRTPWGIANSRMLETRVNTYLAAAQRVEGGKVNWANNPLGLAMRFANRKEVDYYVGELTKIKNTFETAKNELPVLKAKLATTTDTTEITTIESKIADLENTLKGSMAEQAREVFASALTSGRLNRFRESLGMKPANLKETELLKEQIRYGNFENILADASEGGMNFATGGDFIGQATDLARQMGVRVHALSITPPKGKFVKKPGERSYKDQAVSPNDEASMVTWLMRIGYYANDELGTIAVANLDDEVEAIKKMMDWVNNTKQGQKFLSDARLTENENARTLIQRAYNRAKENFVKKDGTTLNVDLLNKIRARDEFGDYKVTGSLSLDDLPSNPLDAPDAIVGPTLIPAVDLDQVTSAVMTNGWTFLGLANARMSRQPIVIQNMLTLRKQFQKSGFEDAWIQSYTKNIQPGNIKGLEKATLKAKKDFAQMVEERALSQVLASVDNPLIRTQLAFSSRNFARFYRATEDFYRRMYRVVRYNPEAIVKAALTYEGVTHSGWIQKDDQGEAYFVYPGIAPVYNAVQGTLKRLGIGSEFKVPFPVEFGAQLKMITPSLNPDSLVPTFSGPISGIAFTTVTELISGLGAPGAADTIKGYALGKYSVDQPIVSSFLPAHINRLYAAMNQDDRNSQYASAWRKAVTYLEASGNGLPKTYDEAGNLLPPSSQEMETYRLAVKNTTLNILGARFVFGFFAPASPQVQLKSDMAQWVSDNGRANFKQAFNKLLDQYPGDYDAAMAKWVELFPNQVAFTVTESEKKSLAPIRYAEEAGYFVDQNKGVFAAFPSAAGFLIPHKSGFSWDAYKTMKDMGLLQNKRVDDYLREVQTAADMQQYFDRKDQFDLSLTQASVDFERTQLRQEFDQWKTVFFAGRPLVQEELSEGSAKAIKRVRTLDELNKMLEANLNIRPKTENKLREMSKIYQNYRNEKDRFDAVGGSQILVKTLKDETIAQLRTLAEYNENTKAAYDVLFGRLLGD